MPRLRRHPGQAERPRSRAAKLVTLGVFGQWFGVGGERSYWRWVSRHLRAAFPTLLCRAVQPAAVRPLRGSASLRRRLGRGVARRAGPLSGRGQHGRFDTRRQASGGWLAPGPGGQGRQLQRGRPQARERGVRQPAFGRGHGRTRTGVPGTQEHAARREHDLLFFQSHHRDHVRIVRRAATKRTKGFGGMVAVQNAPCSGQQLPVGWRRSPGSGRRSHVSFVMGRGLPRQDAAPISAFVMGSTNVCTIQRANSRNPFVGNTECRI